MNNMSLIQIITSLLVCSIYASIVAHYISTIEPKRSQFWLITTIYLIITQLIRILVFLKIIIPTNATDAISYISIIFVIYLIHYIINTYPNDQDSTKSN